MAEFRLPSLGAEMTDAVVNRWLVHVGDRVQRGQALVVVETGKGAIELEGYDDGEIEALEVAEGAQVPVGTVLARIRAATPASAPAPVPVAPPSPSEADRTATLRHTLAESMARSKREIPHYYLDLAIDLRRATAWLADVNRDRPAAQRLLPIALLLRAVAVAAHEIPELNGTWQDNAFRPSEPVHLGVAVALRTGSVMAPALQDAHTRRAPELMADLLGLVERVRTGRLRGADMVQPTLTVTNLGDLGADRVFGVIHPPQVALVGFGRIAGAPWVDGGAVVVAPVVRATLSADHRVSDGMTGSRFLTRIARLLQTPEEL